MTWEDIVKQKPDREPNFEEGIAATFNDDDYHMLQFLVKGAIEHLKHISLPYIKKLVQEQEKPVGISLEDIDLDEAIRDLKKLHQILTGDYSEHHLH